MKCRLGIISTSETIGEPQFLQKRRLTALPLSPRSTNVPRLLSPSNVTDPAGMPTMIDIAVPLWRWQLSQWQTAVIAGCASLR
jgi:hypothetical protein